MDRAITSLIQFPAGWQAGSELAVGTTIEAFVIDGLLVERGEEWPTGTYTYRPAGHPWGRLRAETDSTLLVMELRCGACGWTPIYLFRPMSGASAACTWPTSNPESR